jgi:hypothetical protein
MIYLNQLESPIREEQNWKGTSPGMRHFLRVLQAEQDRGETWGYAFDHAMSLWGSDLKL